MPLQEFCKKPVVTLNPEHTIVEACKLLQEQNVGCIVVVDEGKLCGILTDRDIALKVGGQKYDPQQTKIHEVMTADPVSISVDKSLHDLTTLMHNRHVRRVPVVDKDYHVIGLVTLDDLLMLLSEEFSDMSKGISAALFSPPQQTVDTAVVPPLGWLMSYL